VKLIPDSSFFICFLDDLEGYLPFDERIKVLTKITDRFDIKVGPEVERESPLHKLPVCVKIRIGKIDYSGLTARAEPSLELLRPLLGKGELEVITGAFLHYQNNDFEFLFILDDGTARDLVNQIFPLLVKHMKGTVGFIGHCAILSVVDKEGAIHLLTFLRTTKFRVRPSIITTVIAEIQSRCP
jgi:hypothetical protein